MLCSRGRVLVLSFFFRNALSVRQRAGRRLHFNVALRLARRLNSGVRYYFVKIIVIKCSPGGLEGRSVRGFASAQNTREKYKKKYSRAWLRTERFL